MVKRERRYRIKINNKKQEAAVYAAASVRKRVMITNRKSWRKTFNKFVKVNQVIIL